MLKNMGNCREMARLSVKAIDGKLSLTESFSIKFHVMMCKLCRGYSQEVIKIAELARRHSIDIVDGKSVLGEHRKEKMKAYLQEQLKSSQ